MSNIDEQEIINTLDDLRGLKSDLREKQEDLKALQDEIEGIESDIEGAENSLSDQITAFTEANPNKVPSYF